MAFSLVGGIGYAGAPVRRIDEHPLWIDRLMQVRCGAGMKTSSSAQAPAGPGGRAPRAAPGRAPARVGIMARGLAGSRHRTPPRHPTHDTYRFLKSKAFRERKGRSDAGRSFVDPWDAW